MFNRYNFAYALKQATSRVGMSKASSTRKLVTLPRLPVPPLRETLRKYLLSVRPLLSAQEYAETGKVVEKFGEPGGIGQKLHEILQERAKNHVNWLSDWWLRCAYLEFREPVVAFSSPGLVMPEQKFVSKEDQLRFTSKLITASLKFKKLIDNNQLPQEKSGTGPLDMSQYTRIFGTCRIPKVPCDELLLNPHSKHIVVAHKNNFFKVPVYGKDGAPLNESEVLSQLKVVVEQSQNETDPVGILSSEHRDTWAKSYKQLCSNVENKNTVNDIQKSLFLVCLDKPVVCNGDLNYLTRCALSAIHGGGKMQNSGNRWYDKTVQFVISEDGLVGLTYEHCPAEGPPITGLVDYVMKDIQSSLDDQSSSSTDVEPPERLSFKLTGETQANIEDASRDLDVLIKDLDVNCFRFKTFGKDFIKSQKLSPDSLIQMALQLAFHRLHGSLGATYESASTRMFDLGRTETIRSASIEALKFCETMKGPPTEGAAVKSEALRQAVASHKAYSTAANSGTGVDRLLFGLKRAAVETGMNIPEFYLDPGYTISTHFRLSTSQVPARCDAVMGYGPGVPDGYGCCYNPHPRAIYFAASAWNTSPATNAGKFSGAIEQSLVDIHDVLIAAQTSKL